MSKSTIMMLSGGQVDGQSSSSDAVKNLPGIYIKHVKPDSPASCSGLLKNGDWILEVCNCNCFIVQGAVSFWCAVVLGRVNRKFSNRI